MLLGGLVAYGAHKMSQKDAARIQEHTGVDPEELEDDELATAMQELGIEDQRATPEELAAAGGDAPSTADASPGAAEAPQESYIDELEKLASLRDAGILTDDEFEAKKRQILGL